MSFDMVLVMFFFIGIFNVIKPNWYANNFYINNLFSIITIFMYFRLGCNVFIPAPRICAVYKKSIMKHVLCNAVQSIKLRKSTFNYYEVIKIIINMLFYDVLNRKKYIIIMFRNKYKQLYRVIFMWIFKMNTQ